MIAECSGRQGKFWPVHDRFYENQDEWTLSKSPEKALIALSIEAGVDAFLDMFLTGRYSNAFPSVIDADPAGFVHALAERGYFTAPEASYLAGVEARLAQLEAMNLPDPSMGTS